MRLNIPENLIQSDNFGGADGDANPTVSDEPNSAKSKPNTEQIVPCSIQLRRISQSDISKWQKRKLPDETSTVAKPVNKNYNLRDQQIEQDHPSSRPQHTVSKPPIYTEPTDDSSQDSQVIGMIYTMDKRLIPDEKLEKIVGLSELSAYRMGAQNYIAAKRRGELPAPPAQTLPGFKANAPKSESPDEPLDGNKSTDSNATIIYIPPKLPDRMDTPHKNKRKLHIKEVDSTQGETS